jgi:hypothetical protein
MRTRTLAAIVGIVTASGLVLTASPAEALIPIQPVTAGPAAAPVVITSSVTADPGSSCPTPARGSAVAALPKLSGSLEAAVTRYSRNLPASASVSRWYDSGGSSGGGVPAAAVRDLMRRGLAVGLAPYQVESFLTPSFLRGMNDPRGGPWLFRFIAWENDPTLYQQLASYAQGLAGPERSPMSAQADIFGTFPVLQAAYMAEAVAIPPTLDTAAQIVTLANRGYAPAQRAIQAFLAWGNHPSAGAQNAGGVGDGILPSIYDYLVQNYVGPLSSAARTALVNRGAYDAWVARIATWEANGTITRNVPAVATFRSSLPPLGSTMSSGPSSAACSTP